MTFTRLCPPCVFKVCFCLKPSTSYKLFRLGLKKYQEEIQITHVLKQLRVLSAYTKQQMTKKEWQKLWQDHAVVDVQKQDEFKIREENPMKSIEYESSSDDSHAG